MEKVTEAHRGMGIRIMAYRASLIGAHLTIRALKNDGGPEVCCSWGAENA